MPCSTMRPSAATTWFNNATFSGKTRFNEATFSGDASFIGATFSGDAWFDGVTFSGDAYFSWATFSGDAQFVGVTFSGDAWFHETTFSGDARLARRPSEATPSTDAVFSEPGSSARRSSKHASSAPCWPTGGWCWTTCSSRSRSGSRSARPACAAAERDSPAACSSGCGGPAWCWTTPTLPRRRSWPVSRACPIEALARREKQIARAWQRLLAGEISERPQLMSLRRANVAGLGLSNVSAADCRFAGAHNLDKLRLESDVSFATAPLPVGLGGRRWGGREVIAEERTWRASRSRRSRRHWVAPRWPGWLGDERPDVLDPGQIAGLYRALRKGREDAKDEPGAADFYYGEMEMRRLARPRP